jgi:hypothetical protein
MKATVTILTSFVLVLGLTAGASAALVTETFDTDLGNWTDHDVSNSLPGWANSTNAGGDSAGEWGGTITRQSCSTRPWVGDETIGAISYTDPLKLKFTYENSDISDGDRDPMVMFGYLDTSGANVTGSVMWLQLHRWSDGPGSSGLKLFIGGQMVDSWGYTHNTVSTMDLDYTYDSGTGFATVTGLVTGTSAGDRTINKTTTAQAVGAADAVGLYLESSSSEGNSGRRRNWYIDDVTYGIVPEPATIAILGLGSLVLLRKRR